MAKNENYLLMLSLEKCDDALEELYRSFEVTIRCKAFKYRSYGHKFGLDIDDLVQEGYIGFSQAIVDYSGHQKAAFRTFANICVEREIQNAVASAARKKHCCLNESVSINSENRQGIEYIELIKSHQVSAETMVFDKICEEKDFVRILELLTKLEEKVFILKYNGYEYREIASILYLDAKVVDNALQRIKKKVRKILSFDIY